MRPYQSIKTTVLSLVFILFALSAFTQKPFVNPIPSGKITGVAACGTDAYLHQARLSAAYRAKEEKMNRDVTTARRLDDGQTLVLPVVFHIISQNPAAIPDQAIIDAVKVLNDAFGKTGNYAGSTGEDTKIRFCLAQKDADGGISTGITRTTAVYSDNVNPSTEDAKLKNLVQWDPQKYINIWYVNSISEESVSWYSCEQWNRVMMSGYATMPPNAGSLDGIVVTEFNKVLAHEMGHYLGLYHTFEGGCTNNDCSKDGDKVCDTPPDNNAGAVSSCTNPGSSCNTDTLSGFSSDMPDLVSNFMDYGNDACANAFTKGQTQRMRNAILTQRKGLLEPQCSKPCTESINAAFTRNNANPVTGTTVKFTNASTGAAKYQWLVNGAIASSTTDFSYTFNAPGKYKVTLKASNNSTCFASYSDFVIVTCGVTARFYADKKTVAAHPPSYKENIYFTNTSQGAASYKWLVSNDKGMKEQVVSTDMNLNYTFNTPATYWVKLIAANGNCSDSTERYAVTVTDASADGVIGLFGIECFQQTKLKLSIYFCNFGYQRIYQGVPVSFYDGDPAGAAAKLLDVFIIPDDIPGQCCSRVFDRTIDGKGSEINTLYIVFNDSGTARPWHLPNTPVYEKDYSNNIVAFTNLAFRALINPPTVTAEPGDTIRLSANASGGVATSFTWGPAEKLNCTECTNTWLVVDSTITKRLVAQSRYGCVDTAFIEIKVPPPNDYTLHINEVKCSPDQSLSVSFNINNLAKKGIIPSRLKVSFYDSNPASTNANLLSPVFAVPDAVFAATATFNTIIKGAASGILYGVVNYDGVLKDTGFIEHDYTNNDTFFVFAGDTVSISPADTTVFRKQSFSYRINTMTYDPASTKWFPGDGYTLSCTACANPVITVYNNGKVQMQTANKNGCLVKGEATVKIYPPDITVKILGTECYSANTTRVIFKICMNNGYDSVFKNIPVVFYDSSSSVGNKLTPIFYTPNVYPDSCSVYSAVISTPASSKLHAVINDTAGSSMPRPAYVETNYTNNTSDTTIIPFSVGIVPADTAILIQQSVTLQTISRGGTVAAYSWSPSTFLSCTDCAVPIVTPKYIVRYLLTARNENSCTDTAYAIVGIRLNDPVMMPNAFTPNSDGLNDIFYINAGTETVQVKNFTIFNRWGQKMFEANNFLPNKPAHGWNGRVNGVEAETGTYVYSITVALINGTEKIYKGTVVLVR